MIAICEVKPKKESERLTQDYAIDGYSINHTDIDQEKGRGIIILVHSSISHLVIKINSMPLFEENYLLEIKLKGNDKLIFGCFYRSPTESPYLHS